MSLQPSVTLVNEKLIIAVIESLSSHEEKKCVILILSQKPQTLLRKIRDGEKNVTLPEFFYQTSSFVSFPPSKKKEENPDSEIELSSGKLLLL